MSEGAGFISEAVCLRIGREFVPLLVLILMGFHPADSSLDWEEFLIALDALDDVIVCFQLVEDRSGSVVGSVSVSVDALVVEAKIVPECG